MDEAAEDSWLGVRPCTHCWAACFVFGVVSALSKIVSVGSVKSSATAPTITRRRTWVVTGEPHFPVARRTASPAPGEKPAVDRPPDLSADSSCAEGIRLRNGEKLYVDDRVVSSVSVRVR